MTRSSFAFRSFSTFAAICLVAASSSACQADEWGTLKGKFKFGGAAPQQSELKADKDVEVCGKHKLLAEELVVGADGGVANVVVFVRDKGVKVHPDLEKTKSDPVVLDNKDCRFQPHVAFVRTGQPLVIKNSDSVGHNSNVQTLKNAASNSLVAAGKDATVTFSSEESIPAAVTCNIHPWMKAWVVIRENPYAAVSKPDGSFEIANVPAGDLELQFWHEKAGYIGEASVGSAGKTDKKGRLKTKAKAGDNDLGEILLDAKLFTK